MIVYLRAKFQVFSINLDINLVINLGINLVLDREVNFPQPPPPPPPPQNEPLKSPPRLGLKLLPETVK